MKRFIAPLLAFLIGTLVVAGVAAPPVQTIVASLSVPSAGTILDTNAPASTIPVVNAAHQYTYQTLPAAFVPTPAATATVIGWNGGWTAPSPIATATNGVTVSLYGGQSAGLTPIGPYSVNANNTGATATPIPISAAALAGMLSGSNGCPPNIQTFTGTSTDTSGTYTTPTCNGVTATVLWIRVVGGGGGGGAVTTGAGGNGDSSTVGTTFLTAGGGTGGNANGQLGQSGGTASGGNIANIVGGPGNSGIAGAQGLSGAGGSNPLGTGGQGSASPGSIGNTCGGGGSGGGNASSATGQSGGAGGYVEDLLTAPAASYSYTAGKYGAGGSGSGNAGGHGGGGCVIFVASWGTL